MRLLGKIEINLLKCRTCYADDIFSLKVMKKKQNQHSFSFNCLGRGKVLELVKEFSSFNLRLLNILKVNLIHSKTLMGLFNLYDLFSWHRIYCTHFLKKSFPLNL